MSTDSGRWKTSVEGSAAVSTAADSFALWSRDRDPGTLHPHQPETLLRVPGHQVAARGRGLRRAGRGGQGTGRTRRSEERRVGKEREDQRMKHKWKKNVTSKKGKTQRK